MAKKKPSSNTSSSNTSVARDVVADFLKSTIDAPDLEKAKTLLTTQSLASGSFHGEGPPPGTAYSIGEQSDDPVIQGGVLIPVTLKGPDPSGESREMVMPFILIQEDNQWKIDLNASTERMFNPMMEALKDAAQQMGEVMGKAMEGIGQALSQGLSGSHSGGTSAPPNIDPDRLEKFTTGPLESFRAGLQEALDAPILLDLDLPSFLGHDDPQENAYALDLFEQDIFRPFDYHFREVHAKMPLGERLAVIRFEPAASAADRILFLDGSRLIYRFHLGRGDEGVYSFSDLEQILPPLLAGLPERIDPREPPAPGPASWSRRDPSTLTALYQSKFQPFFLNRISELVQHEVALSADLDSFPSDSLFLWGFQRVAGALAHLATDEAKLDILKQELQSISLSAIHDPGQKLCAYSAGILLINIAPLNGGGGEQGAFYEWQIADALTTGLKLAERPALKDLYNEAATWEERLKELFGTVEHDGSGTSLHPIAYHIDWDGFISHPDTSTNLRGLHILKEHGIDHLYYAISGLAEKNPNFRQQFAKRVKTLKLLHTPDAKQKSLAPDEAGDGAILYKLAIHTGYDGYLTLDQMEKALPKIVAAMPDLPPDAFYPVSDTATTDSSDEEELRELQQLQRDEAERLEDDDSEEESEDAEEETDTDEKLQLFNQARVEIQNTLPMYQSQMEAIVGKSMDVAIDWDSLENDPEAIPNLLTAALTPILGGLAYLAQDPSIRTTLHDTLDHILLARTKDPAQHGFALDDTTLIYRAYLGSAAANISPMDPQVAQVVLRNLITGDTKQAKSTKSPKSTAKKPAKPAPKPAKPAPKTTAKSAKKPPPKKPKRR